MQCLGRGSYPVWKNRLKGQQLNVWQKNYNNTITGESYSYLEFKGWYSEIYWVPVHNQENNFTVYPANEHVFFQMLQPAKQASITNNNTFTAIPGEHNWFLSWHQSYRYKISESKYSGPQGQKYPAIGSPITGILFFDFLPP